MLSLNETSHSMLFWAPNKGPSFVNKTKKLHMYQRKPSMLYSISNKLQRVSVCLNMLHLFDRTDKKIAFSLAACFMHFFAGSSQRHKQFV